MNYDNGTNAQNGDSMHLTKIEVLGKAAELLAKFPDTLKCVRCGYTKPATWQVVDGILDDEDTEGVQITLSAGIYKGWCAYAEDPKRGLKAGDHCPQCYYETRKL